MFSLEEVDSPHFNFSDSEPALILHSTIFALLVREHVYPFTVARYVEALHVRPRFASVLFIKRFE